jgi:hypothetical protein
MKSVIMQNKFQSLKRDLVLTDLQKPSSTGFLKVRERCECVRLVCIQNFHQNKTWKSNQINIHDGMIA